MTSAFAVSAHGLGKRFPGVRALDDFDFDLCRGEVHCLLGENGAGKSTFIKILSGAFVSYDGDVRVSGRKVRITSPAVASVALEMIRGNAVENDIQVETILMTKDDL